MGGLLYMVWKNVCLCVCVTPLYLKNWTLLDFHTWRVYTPPKWQERALTNIFPTILEAIKNGKKSARCGFFQSSRLLMHLTKHKFTSLAVLTTPLSTKQVKIFEHVYFESYKADKSFMKHPAHNYSIY